MLSAGIVILRADSAQRWQALLLRAYRYWDFPKGHVEPGEEPHAAALREVQEETGIAPNALEFRWSLRYFETEMYAHGKIARYYVACTRADAVRLAPLPGQRRAEHHEYRWCYFSEAYGLLAPRVQKILQTVESIVAYDAGD